MMGKVLLVPGSASRDLAKRISEFLDVPLVDPQLKRFANGEVCCEISKSVRGATVFVIQSTCTPVNDHLMELLVILDALKRASAASIVAVIPHYGYSRQDRKVSPRTPITAKLVADLITVAGATRVMTMDLHAGQVQGFFNIPFDNIYSSPVILKYITGDLLPKSENGVICVSPDAGGMERTRHYAKKMGTGLAMIDKRRTGPNVAQAMHVVGDVEGKDVIIIDDMIDTAGTLIEAVKALKGQGARKVYAAASHGIFSDPAAERIGACADLEEVIVTDTVPLAPALKALKKIKLLPTTEIFAKAIHRTSNNSSVSSLFI